MNIFFYQLLKQSYRTLVSLSLLFLLLGCGPAAGPASYTRSSDNWNRPIPYLIRIKDWQRRERSNPGPNPALRENLAKEGSQPVSAGQRKDISEIP